MGCTCCSEVTESENTRKNIQKESVNKRENINKNKKEIIVYKPFNKENCKSIVSTIPIRTKTDLQSLKDIMKSKTKNLSEIEKSFIIFLWISQNIDYDAEGYFAGRDVNCTPQGVFQNGKTVCSGYARLYLDIASNLELKVECVNCYAKGVGYEPGQKMTSTNHEYNVVYLKDKWLPIDSTWGSGHIEGKSYVREYNEFYFLSNPELLIKTHFPKEEKWQLTKKKYTLDDFLSWPKIYDSFYKYGFIDFTPEKGLIQLKNENSQKFIVWGDNVKQKGASCNVYLLDGNCYIQQRNLDFINFYDDKLEVNCIFNKKGKYKVQIFGNNDGGTTSHIMMEYTLNVEKNAKNELQFPHTYNGSKVIKIIEPLYNNLKSGSKVKFKIESDLDTIIIIDESWHYLKRNEQGFFEEEITIITQAGKNVVIGKQNSDRKCSYLVTYDVI